MLFSLFRLQLGGPRQNFSLGGGGGILSQKKSRVSRSLLEYVVTTTSHCFNYRSWYRRAVCIWKSWKHNVNRTPGRRRIWLIHPTNLACLESRSELHGLDRVTPLPRCTTKSNGDHPHLVGHRPWTIACQQHDQFYTPGHGRQDHLQGPPA
jgi:hypothetical protein